MKLALMGDIHGNLAALISVLDAAESSGVEQLLLTGDLVGYYFEPGRVMEQLGKWKYFVVRGNHEEMLMAARADAGLAEQAVARYGSGIQIALQQLNEKQLSEISAFLHPLHLDIDGCRILLCHGAPWDLNAYIYPDAPIELRERCATPGFDLVVLGHTHYPMSFQVRETLVVNPGSVGQPRNGQPGAHWALFDTSARTLEFRVESYEVAPLVRECQIRHPEIPYLADVLTRTR